MDSEEAIMENENNSNVESESGIRAQKLTVEGQYGGVSSTVTGVPGDTTPSVVFTDVGSADSSSSQWMEAVNSNIREEYTPANVDVWTETFDSEQHVAGTSESTCISDNKDKDGNDYEDFTGADSSQDYGEKHSLFSDNVNSKCSDGPENERQSCMQISNSGSHEEGDDIISESSLVIQKTYEMQHMDVDEILESTVQSSEIIKNRKLELNANFIIESNNSNKAAKTCKINSTETSEKFSTVAGVSNDMNDDVDLLAEDYQDCDSPKDKNDGLNILADNRDLLVLSDQNRTCKHDKLQISSHSVQTVTDANVSEELLEFAKHISVKTVTGSTLTSSDHCDATEPEDMDELLEEEGINSAEFSKKCLAQTQAPNKNYEENVDGLLHQEPFTCNEKKDSTFSDNISRETYIIPKLSTHSDIVHENISDANQSGDNGAQESDIDIYHKKVDNQGKHSLQESTAMSDHVVTDILEPEGVGDVTFKILSFNSTNGINSSVEHATVDSSSKSCTQIEDRMNATTDKVDSETPSSPENTALAVEFVSTDAPQSSISSNVHLELEHAIASDVFKSVEAANKKNASEGEALDKYTSDQSLEKSSRVTNACDLETENSNMSSASAEKGNCGQKVSEKGNGAVSSDISLTKNVGTCYRDEDDDVHEIMEISEIKKEHGTIDSNVSSDVVHKNAQLSAGIKQELNADRLEDSEEEVMVVDDDGEIVSLKTETSESRGAQNGLGIQISAVSGQQHHLYANEEQRSDTSSDAGNKTDDTARSKAANPKLQTCIVCQKICKCKYNIVRNGDIKHLCDDTCFKKFRKSPGVFLIPKDDVQTPKTSLKETVPALISALTTASVESRQDSTYKTCNVCQLIDVNTNQPFCNWKGLNFCGESCLGKFQSNLNTSCSFCHAYIAVDMRTTFCLKIGNDMRPFCKQRCYSEFKKKLRLCSFCQRDVAAVPEAFTAMVGSDGKFKEFCSQACMKKMESQISDVEILSVEKGNLKLETITCSVCEKQGSMKYTVRLQDRVNKLCSDLCFSAFQYTNKINMGKCDTCSTAYTAEEAQAHFVQYEGKVKRFCSDVCVSQFRKTNSNVVPCTWCSTKKLNFDMIERLDADNKVKMFCSLSCLSLFRVNLQAKSNEAVSCDQCRKVVPAQYHLTMSDASVLNFCSYSCVMTFQTQFAVKRVSPNLGPTLPTSATSLPPSATSLPPSTTSLQIQQPVTPALQKNAQSAGGRMTTRQVTAQHQSVPVISNVISLAQHGGGIEIQSFKPSQSTPSFLVPTPDTVTTAEAGSMMSSGDGKHQIIIQAAVPKFGKNKSLQCRPFTQTKATSCRPHSQSKEVQTDEVINKPILIPVPVPIYIPMPTVMFSALTPKLIPIPIPIPVPIFIPTTRKSVNGICKTIQEIVERIPNDPLEAELLMMAEAVAADKISEDRDSESEVDDFLDHEESEAAMLTLTGDEPPIISKRADSNEEDVLQTALRMAEEMSGPIEDLEASLELVAVGTEPPSQQPKTVPFHHVEDDADYSPPQSLRSRGTKRATRGRPPSSRSKRQRLERSYIEEDSMQVEPKSQSNSVEPAPDVNFRLKFMYGVNSWRHWVISKNMQIEKSRSAGNFRGSRVFPTDILKCTMDELNMSLCMFVKEVRKPSGEEYSPDSIYYLCLGLQQYLYENGRIDSIFTDTYFEKFTDCMNEILKNLQPKVNTQGQMLCRIEEEHLWESKHLGAHSPFVLLNTLIYFHTKHFILKTVPEHMTLSFAQILKHWKKGLPVKGQTTSTAKNVSLRFYCLANGKKESLVVKKNKEGVPVYEVVENIDNPLRCPVKLYEFFLSKCPESIKNRNDIFYPVPERSCVPDSPVWYSTQSIDFHTLDKMLTRILLVREIQEAHLHAQPIYM